MAKMTHDYLETTGLKPAATEISKAQIAINLVDKTLWTKDANGTVISVGGGATSTGSYVAYRYVVGTASGTYTNSLTVFPAAHTIGNAEVYLDGIKLVNGVDYTETTTDITLGTSATVGQDLEVIAFNMFTLADSYTQAQIDSKDAVVLQDAKTYVDSLPVVPPYTYKAITANYTASAVDFLKIDTSLSVITVTLPVAPAENDTINFIDVKGTFDINALTIARNGKLIMGLAQDMIVSTKNISFELIYTNGDWRII